MNSTSSRGSFVLEGLRVGEQAHGHGHLADGREFSFVLRRGVARLVVYRADAPSVPGRADVEWVQESPVEGVDPADRRVVGALLRSMVTAVGVRGS
ncbi:hypothetical protein N8J89_20915 [Crossiella sp. CA-258035]|uniref:hypothetical protein n=1 Tax=Crossiella sp. CA-258035 TaxID=2981138 RepID=UPI0024BCB036|nr:hypothetical protein [Crossiella sp. CA-258035]WHT15611.1 hypothetical protein N8J89_20915 [Crossiella sp. CA-258035]